MDVLLTLAASLPVAVVTAIITSWLTRRRTRQDRLEAIQLEAYRDLAVSADRFGRAFGRVNRAEVEGREFEESDWLGPAEQLLDKLALLSVVAEADGYQRVHKAFEQLRSSTMEVDLDDPKLTTSGTQAAAQMQLDMRALQAAVRVEARRAIGPRSPRLRRRERLA